MKVSLFDKYFVKHDLKRPRSNDTDRNIIKIGPYFHSIRPRITMPKNGTVYGAVYYENTAVNRPILMMLRSVFLRQINGPYTDRIVRPG